MVPRENLRKLDLLCGPSMSRFCRIGILVFLLQAHFSGHCILQAQESTATSKSNHELLGTWQLISCKINGSKINFRNVTNMKHITSAAFVLTAYDGNGEISRVIGGKYKLEGENYLETPAYGSGRDFQIVKGKSQSFTWKVKGNKWLHSGKLTDGTEIEEIWQKVE